MLSVFYDFNGELNFGFLSNPKIKNSVIGKNYIKYVLINYPDAVGNVVVNHMNRLQNQKNCILCNAISILSVPGILYRTTNVNSPDKYLSKLLKELKKVSTDYLSVDETALVAKGLK